VVTSRNGKLIDFALAVGKGVMRRKLNSGRNVKKLCNRNACKHRNSWKGYWAASSGVAACQLGMKSRPSTSPDSTGSLL